MKRSLLPLVALAVVSLGSCSLRDENIRGADLTDITCREEGELDSHVVVTYPRMKARPGTPRFELNEAIRSRFMKEFGSSCEDIFAFAAETKKEIEANPEWDGFSQRNWKKELTYTPEHLSATLVSLRITLYWWAGGAHGNRYFIPVNYQWTEKGVREVGLADLFDPSADWAVPVSRMIWREFVRMRTEDNMPGDYLRQLARTDIASLKGGYLANGLIGVPFTFSAGGITFHYEPYALGSFAEGDFHVQVSLSDLRRLLARDGPMGRWLD